MSNTSVTMKGPQFLINALKYTGNKFTGTVPQEVCDRNFNGQWFSGHPSGIGRDGCTSVACPVNTEAKHQGVYPCTPCAELFLNPYIGSNECVALNQVSVCIIYSNGSML